MRRFILLAPLALLWVIAGAVPDALAYTQWSTARNSGNCANCHGNFRTNGYASAKDGVSWGGGNLHDEHRNVMLSGDCNTCHQALPAPRFPVQLGNSAGGAGFPAISCLGCHGRAEDAGGDGLSAGLGRGLRQHHQNAGITICAGCHSDSTGPVGVAESVPPPYYFSPDTAHPNKPTDPCLVDPALADPGRENRFGPTGLDNDGDLLDDGADSDCVAAFPDIAVAPLSLDFGTVIVGDTSPAQTVTIENVGTANLQVTGLNLTGSPDFDLVAPPATPFTIAPNGSQTVDVVYIPSDIGPDSGALEIASDDPDPNEQVVSVTLSGTGVVRPEPNIVLTPDALDFGPVTVGGSSTLSTQIGNSGTADLEVSSIAACAGTSGEFTFVDLSPLTIPPGGSQPLSVTYTPVDDGDDPFPPNCLEIASSDPTPGDSPAILALSGSGVGVCDIDVAPLVLGFGIVPVGSVNTLSTSVGNTGTADCTVGSLVVSGDPEFALGAGAPTLPFTVLPGGPPVNVPVTYSPTTAGASHSGTLSIGSNDPDEAAVDVALSGSTAAEPDIDLDPVALDFGVVTVGSSSTLTSEVRNIGTDDLVVSAVDLCAGTSTEFDFAPLASTTIPPGGSETLSVTFTPADAGTETGCIAIASNDRDEATVQLDVAGTGFVPQPLVCTLDVAPSLLDFGVVIVGDTATLPVGLQNTGDDICTVTVVAAPGTSSEFSFAPASFDVPVGGSQTVSVTYAPVDTGLDTGSLEIASNDPASPAVVDLQGTGTPPVQEPDIALVPTDLAFGNVMIGSMSTLSADIRNLGNADLEVLIIDRCAGTSTEYSFAPSAPLTIPPGGAQALSVTYSPADPGEDLGCIAIDSNDPDEPTVELGLSGAGIDQPPMAEVMIKVPGAINPKSRGVTPVRFWTEMMDLEIAMVTCGPAMAEPKRLNVEDFNDDGYDDVVGLFATRDLGVACGNEVLACQGMLADGTSFTGTSTEFKVVGPECKPSNKLAKRGR